MEVTLYEVKGGGHGFRGAAEDSPADLFDMAARFDGQRDAIEQRGPPTRTVTPLAAYVIGPAASGRAAGARGRRARRRGS